MLAAGVAIEQMAGWGNVESLDWNTREDMSSFRESFREIENLAVWAGRVLEHRLALLAASDPGRGES